MSNPKGSRLLTLETAPTQHVETGGVRFAYRRLGSSVGIPLVLMQHFTGHMDAWDPELVNALAQDRPVVVFNNAGVGTSTGVTPDTVAQMTEDAERFLQALGLAHVDLLGFSLGGFIAQDMAARDVVSVRKMVLVGTAPRGGEEHLLDVVAQAASHTEAPDIRLPLFFTGTAQSQAAGRAFLVRAAARIQQRDPESGDAVQTAQARAIVGWCAESDPGHASLKAIHQPALVVHGSDDTMFPSVNAFNLARAMKDATLIIYPDSGHGVLFQYPALFAGHAMQFLDA
jgi:pimeloyl-ACP methyl ester carboxylesterase